MDLHVFPIPIPNVLDWRIPWTEEPSGLQSMGSRRVRHNLANKQQQLYFKKKEREHPW